MSKNIERIVAINNKNVNIHYPLNSNKNAKNAITLTTV